MAEKEFVQQNVNKKEKNGSILRHILKVKEELIELPDYAILTDRMDGGSSCETITLDDEFTPRNADNVCEYHRETFSDDSLDDSIGKDIVSNLGGMKQHGPNHVGSMTSTSLKVSGEKPFKKPSMIPKLSRTCRIKDNVKANSNEQKYFYKNSPLDEPKNYQNMKTYVKNPKYQVDIPPMKLTTLQQKLKATTSIIKQKMEYGNPRVYKDTNIGRNRSIQSNSSSALIGQEKPINNLASLYRNIVQMRETALALSKSDNFKNQKVHIEKLFKNISDIQNIADKLNDIERKRGKFKSNLQSVLMKNSALSRGNVGENKIHDNNFSKISEEKPSKYNNLKRKTGDLLGKFKEATNSFITIGFKKKNVELKREDNSKIQIKKEIQKVDSMDGIFIPICNPLPFMEEDEETEGLENDFILKQKISLYKPTSNSCQRLSEISTEATKTLKRCPKDFTLRMDFIHEKLLFQSMKKAANNIPIEPDIQLTENPVDEKKSDIINIKPFTECSFASQLISVDSYKSLRSTDSEIFNAVNLPLVPSNKSRNVLAIRSCGAFYRNDSWSVVVLTKQNVTSMPEITGPVEDAFAENITGIDDTTPKKTEESGQTNKKRIVK